MNAAVVVLEAAARLATRTGQRGAFTSACTPDVVLELIAEREKLRADLTRAYLSIAVAQRALEGG